MAGSLEVHLTETFLVLSGPYEAEVRSVHQWTHHLNTETDDPAMADYLDACEDYFMRQLLVYENWPQETWSTLGYTGKTVFQDQNA